jgi:hypothetical protein
MTHDVSSMMVMIAVDLMIVVTTRIFCCHDTNENDSCKCKTSHK